MPAVTADGGPRSLEGPLRIAAIAVGGALGTLSRYGVARALAVPPGRFPWATFVVNVVGSFLDGPLHHLVGLGGEAHQHLAPRPGPAQLGQHDHVGLAAGYIGASLVVGVAASALGMLAARGRLLPPGRGPIPDPDALGSFGDGSGGRRAR